MPRARCTAMALASMQPVPRKVPASRRLQRRRGGWFGSTSRSAASMPEAWPPLTSTAVRVQARQRLALLARGAFVAGGLRPGQRRQLGQVRRDEPAQRHQLRGQAPDRVLGQERRPGGRRKNRVQHCRNMRDIAQHRHHLVDRSAGAEHADLHRPHRVAVQCRSHLLRHQAGRHGRDAAEPSVRLHGHAVTATQVRRPRKRSSRCPARCRHRRWNRPADDKHMRSGLIAAIG